LSPVHRPADNENVHTLFSVSLGAKSVVTLHGDGQHSPDDIGRLLKTVQRFPDQIVIAARLHDKQNFPSRRYYVNQYASFWISWAAGYPIADAQSGFPVYPATLLRQLTRQDVSWNGFVIDERNSDCGWQYRCVKPRGSYPRQLSQAGARLPFPTGV